MKPNTHSARAGVCFLRLKYTVNLARGGGIKQKPEMCLCRIKFFFLPILVMFVNVSRRQQINRFSYHTSRSSDLILSRTCIESHWAASYQAVKVYYTINLSSPLITVIYPLLSGRGHHFTIVLTCIKRWHNVSNLFLHTRHKKIPCLFPQIIKAPEINVSNVFSVMIVPIVFEIQLSFCLQEKISWEWYQEECKTLRDSPF